MLATGGIGGLYAHTTNPLSAQGGGLALAARAGAVLRDLEFVQFHPTAIAAGLDPMPLATEALRGEGAVLVNSRGEQFMEGIPEAELAPRDVVARAIFAQICAGERIFLDTRHVLGDHIATRFPGVTALCRAAGLDPSTTLFRYARLLITTWAGSRWTIRAAAPLRGSGPAARSPRPACMGPTAWRATRSLRHWPMPPGSLRTSKGLQARSLIEQPASTSLGGRHRPPAARQQSQDLPQIRVLSWTGRLACCAMGLDCRTPSVGLHALVRNRSAADVPAAAIGRPDDRCIGLPPEREPGRSSAARLP